MTKSKTLILPLVYLSGVMVSVGAEFFGFHAVGGESFAWGEALSFAAYWPFRLF